MDLNSALQLNRNTQYRDYQDPKTRDRDFNQSVTNHIFDLGTPQTQVPYYYAHVNPHDTSRHYSEYATPDQDVAPATHMSRPYLLMKQAQERETLMESSVANPFALTQLQTCQTDEIRRLSDQMQMQHANKYLRFKEISASPSSVEINRTHQLQHPHPQQPRQITREITHRYQQIMSAKK